MVYQSGKYGEAKPSVPFSKAAPAKAGGIKGTGGGGYTSGGGSASGFIEEEGKPIIYTSEGKQYYKTVTGEKVEVSTGKTLGVYKDVVVSSTEQRTVLRTPSGTRVLYPSTTPGAVEAERTPLHITLGYRIAQKYRAAMGGRFTVSKQQDLLIIEEEGRKKGYAGYIPKKQISTDQFYTTTPHLVFDIPATATYQKGESFERGLKQYEIIEVPLKPGYHPTPQAAMRKWKPEYEAKGEYLTTETIKAGGREIVLITGRSGQAPIYTTQQRIAATRLTYPIIYGVSKGFLTTTSYMREHPIKTGGMVVGFGILSAVSPVAASVVGGAMGIKWVYDIAKAPEVNIAEEVGGAIPYIAAFSIAGYVGTKVGTPFRTSLARAYETRLTTEFSRRQFDLMKKSYGTYEYGGETVRVYKLSAEKYFKRFPKGTEGAITPTRYTRSGFREIYLKEQPRSSLEKVLAHEIQHVIMSRDQFFRKYKAELALFDYPTKTELYEAYTEFSKGQRVPFSEWLFVQKRTGFLVEGAEGEVTGMRQLQLRPKPVDIMYKPEALATEAYPDATRGVKKFSTQYVIRTRILEGGRTEFEIYDPRTKISEGLKAKRSGEKPTKQTFIYAGLYLDPLTAYASQVTKGVDLFEKFGGEYYKIRPRFELGARDFLREGAKPEVDTGVVLGVRGGVSSVFGTIGKIRREYKSIPSTIFDVRYLPIEIDITKSIQKQRVALDLDQIQKQRQKQRPIVINTFDITGLPEEDFTRDNTDKLPEDKPPEEIKIDLFTFKVPKYKKKKLGSIFAREIISPFSTKYFASVEATAFNIKGSKPSKRMIATGLPLRPISM